MPSLSDISIPSTPRIAALILGLDGPSSHLFAGAAAADEAFQHAAAQFPCLAVYRKTAAGTSHLIHEIHQACVEVILDERECAGLDAGLGAGVDLFERVPGG